MQGNRMMQGTYQSRVGIMSHICVMEKQLSLLSDAYMCRKSLYFPRSPMWRKQKYGQFHDLSEVERAIQLAYYIWKAGKCPSNKRVTIYGSRRWLRELHVFGTHLTTFSRHSNITQSLSVSMLLRHAGVLPEFHSLIFDNLRQIADSWHGIRPIDLAIQFGTKQRGSESSGNGRIGVI